MINLNELDKYRRKDGHVIARFGGIGDHTCGMFEIPSKTDNQTLRVIATNDEGWDHVSVSRKNRCPNWLEMEQIKRMFFEDGETAFQLHVPVSDHINIHPYCLHIWRPHKLKIPMPPDWMVG